jgi:hypothetical protein
MTAVETDETHKTQDGQQGREDGPLRRGFFRVWRLLVSAGFLFGIVAFILFIRFSGLIDIWLPETGGVVHIESPQIYTRERLVNDRFREQAWLERQLVELEDRAALISSARKDSFRFSAGAPAPAPGGGGDPATPSPPPPPDTDPAENLASNEGDLEEQLLVSADDSFNLQRNMRATIRRALIENELDDRHDLGSNSLYQFNFGAAIIAGTRTRRIAAIDMEIEPVDPLEPMDRVVDDPQAPCSGLFEFECAWLMDRGIVDAATDDDRMLVEDYNRWKALFQKWLGSENASYQRESEDIDLLLSSTEASRRIQDLMEPFFSNLDFQARRFVNSFNRISSDVGGMEPGECRFTDDTQPVTSIHNQLDRFISKCITATNNRLADIGTSSEGVLGFLSQYILDVQQIEAERFPDEKLAEYWNQYFKYVFNQFNDQCSWTEDLIEKIDVGDRSYYKLADTVGPSLLACISRSVVRDYGSHPFGQVERIESGGGFQGGSDAGQRADISAYLARKGFSSIIATSRQASFRSQDRTEFVGIIARRTDKAEQSGLIPYPHGTERLNATCRHYLPIEVPGKESGTGLKFGISSVPYFKEFPTTYVDGDIGWNFLSHLMCDTYEDTAATPKSGFFVDRLYNIPIGLFRFINILSGSQRTFSYSVQPSGAFNLQQRSSQTTWDWSGIIPGQNRQRQIAAGGDTTESWIEKQYRVIGFGAQVDYKDVNGERVVVRDLNNGASDPERRASFGWYVFPANSRGRLFGLPTMDSANVKLAALVSLPAWWERVDIKITTSWRDPNSPDKERLLRDEEAPAPQVFRVELPTRLEFIRNHFPHTAALRPSLYQLQIPHIVLRACEDADIALKGERLWRSTVVTLGSQKSSLIQVMPDMRGIIAHFSEVVPIGVPKKGTPMPIPLTIWTSEGQKAVVDTVSLSVPDSVVDRIHAGLPPCETGGGGDTE